MFTTQQLCHIAGQLFTHYKVGKPYVLSFYSRTNLFCSPARNYVGRVGVHRRVCRITRRGGPFVYLKLRKRILINPRGYSLFKCKLYTKKL